MAAKVAMTKLKQAPFPEAVLSLAPHALRQIDLEQALASFNKILKKAYGEDTLAIPHGSVLQGAHLESSDLHLMFNVPGEEAPATENEDGTPVKVDSSKQILALNKVIAAAKGPFRVVESGRMTKTSKVPHVVLSFKAQGSAVDLQISIGTELNDVDRSLTDKIIRRVISRTAKILHTVRIVKLWARAEKLSKAADGHLCPLGWALLVLYFYFERGDVNGAHFYEEEANENGKDGDLTALPPLLFTSTPEEELTKEELEAGVPERQDLADFFEWVNTFDTWWPKDRPLSAVEDGVGLWALSLVDGAVIEIPDQKKQVPTQADLYIEDPGIKITNGTSENVAASLKSSSWKTALSRCGVAAAALRSEKEKAADQWLFQVLQKAQSSAAPAAAATPPKAGGAAVAAGKPQLPQKAGLRPAGTVVAPSAVRPAGGARPPAPKVGSVKVVPATRPAAPVRPGTAAARAPRPPSAQGGARPVAAVRPAVRPGVRPGFQPVGPTAGSAPAVRPGIAQARPGVTGAKIPPAGVKLGQPGGVRPATVVAATRPAAAVRPAVRPAGAGATTTARPMVRPHAGVVVRAPAAAAGGPPRAGIRPMAPAAGVKRPASPGGISAFQPAGQRMKGSGGAVIPASRF